MIILISERAIALSGVKNKKQEGAFYVLLVFAFKKLYINLKTDVILYILIYKYKSTESTQFFWRIRQ